VKTGRSRRLFERARRVIPGGVNSPVRAFGSVGQTPRFITHARGAKISDADGNDYIDYVGSWGPMILGHAHPDRADGCFLEDWPARTSRHRRLRRGDSSWLWRRPPNGSKSGAS
jgi:hypothetical protein